ncbi:MAG: type I glyceraldehyde-3-phosphate dehydrogenase [bacterium]|nr:type I glyceraldehyde-3-phosphate dehydrogenase [bacterium]
MKLAINGFGRIGRSALKIALENPQIEIVAINDLTDAKTLAHLLQYDTAYGIYSQQVESQENNLIIAGKTIPVYAIKEPETLPWKDLQVDVVLECTGRFVESDKAGLHIKAGAKKVVISAPSKGENAAPTYVLGVNDQDYKGEAVINNASCTTNCIAPVMKVLQEKFGVKKAILDTIHAYTHDQNIQDGPHKDLRRARAAAANMVPTSTGAAIAATEVIPALKGKFDGTSIRVPVLVGSISDITVVLEKPATVEEINNAFIEASKTDQLKDILTTTREPIVSSDIVGNPASSIVDLAMTQVVDGDLVKVFAWYDNEWGYSNRLVEIAAKIAQYQSTDNKPVDLSAKTSIIPPKPIV